jgi:ionotropic glutamate receptor NMDA 1
MLENDLGFKADLHVVKDGKYGALNDGKWNGLIGELVRGEADLAIADLTITDSRSRAVNFTQPFLHSGMNILVVVKKDFLKRWLPRFLEPFSTDLWFATVLTINIIFILLWVIDKQSPYGHYKKGKDYKEKKKFHMIASLWFSWGTVFHIDECEARPRSYSSRLVTVVFAFAMLVVTNTYTANLAAGLVSEGEVLPISGIQDPKVRFVAIEQPSPTPPFLPWGAYRHFVCACAKKIRMCLFCRHFVVRARSEHFPFNDLAIRKNFSGIFERECKLHI